MPDPTITKRLLDELGITRQAVDSRVKTIQRHLAISKNDATYLIAFEANVKIDDRLDPETLERVSRYAAMRRRGTEPAHGGNGTPKGSPKSALVKIANVQVEDIPGLSPAHAREAGVMAEKVYPILYVFENSARDIIARVLEANLGADWWDKVAYSELKREVKRRRTQEGEEAWHSKRADNPLAYLDLGHLSDLVGKPTVWPYFQEIFPRDNWFSAVVDDLKVSRRVIAHMNPLSEDDIKQVEAGFRRWVKQIRAKAHLLP